MPTVDALILQLLSENKKKRREAAELLGQLGDPKAVSPLLGIVHNSYEDTDVRIAATRSVAKIGDLNAIPDLLRIPPDDRHLIGRVVQDSEREDLLEELCGESLIEDY